jgi:hypothetical protein
VAHLVFVRKKKIRRRRRRNVYSMGCEGDDKEFLKLNDQRKHFYKKQNKHSFIRLLSYQSIYIMKYFEII